MAEDDAKFDIDFYEDDEPSHPPAATTQNGQQTSQEYPEDTIDYGDDYNDDTSMQQTQDALTPATEPSSPNYEKPAATNRTTADTSMEGVVTPTVPQNGLKRKDGSDNRPVADGAMNAVILAELPWHTSEDDIRGWANQSGCEDELKLITFNEHKVNGKSKGQAFIEFTSPQAATALKQTVEGFYKGLPGEKQYTVTFSSPTSNPFHTLPKDPQGRQNTTNSRGGGGGGSFSSRGNFTDHNYRGGRGGMNRGGGFRGGFQGMGMGMPNFGSAAAMSGFGGGFNNAFGGRGGMNMMGGGSRGRGGRGGMNMMNGMGMAPMMPGMGMAGMPMMGAMGAGQFNPGFFQGQQQQMGASPAGENWNPHGAKRIRES